MSIVGGGAGKIGVATARDVWDPPKDDPSFKSMDVRIMSLTDSPIWREVVRAASSTGKPVGGLAVAEIGCGTGTMSLTLGLAGASVTLIDFNRKVLDRAALIYGRYECPVKLIEADCLAEPPDDIRERFDIVISVGLAEHFSNEARARCMKYHAMLLKKGGFAVLNVPNNLSPFYWLMRLYRAVTGTWGIDIEIPFSRFALARAAINAGLKEVFILGNSGVWQDALGFWLGVKSVVAKAFPADIAGKSVPSGRQEIPAAEIRECVRKRFEESMAQKSGHDLRLRRLRMRDIFSSAIVLFARKE